MLSRKRARICFTAIFAAVFVFTTSCSNVSHPASYREIGCPAGTVYSAERARCAWDMTIFDNRLYVGSGDYDRNVGSVAVLSCALDDIGNWQQEESLPDEEINRFLLLDGTLTIPGTDPVGEPDTGTYYQLVDSEWVTKSGILDGQHNFDLIRYDGMLFAGIGADRGKTSVICSKDGEHFERLPMVKDGNPISTADGECIRTHDFFLQNDTLYATLWYENLVTDKLTFDLYRYENGAFVFHSDWLSQIGAKELWNVPVGAKVNFADKVFFTTGYLFSTSDMSELTPIVFPKEAVVYDLLVDDNTLYVLTATETEEGYQTVIYQNTTGEPDEFRELIYFDYELPPMSFACTAEHFYIGTGDFQNANEKNGTILEVER